MMIFAQYVYKMILLIYADCNAVIIFIFYAFYNGYNYNNNALFADSKYDIILRFYHNYFIIYIIFFHQY